MHVTWQTFRRSHVGKGLSFSPPYLTSRQYREVAFDLLDDPVPSVVLGHAKLARSARAVSADILARFVDITEKLTFVSWKYRTMHAARVTE